MAKLGTPTKKKTNTFMMNGKKMVLNRGRYKTPDNVGSKNEAKGGGFIAAMKEQGKQNKRLKEAKAVANKQDKTRMTNKMARTSYKGKLAETQKEINKQYK